MVPSMTSRRRGRRRVSVDVSSFAIGQRAVYQDGAALGPGRRPDRTFFAGAVTYARAAARKRGGSPSSTLLGSGEGGGEAVEGDGLMAEGAGAEDEGEHDLQFVQDLVEGHPGAGTCGSVLIMVQKAWARAARVTWRCQPVKERPSKWSRPRPVFSSGWSCSIRQRIFASRTSSAAGVPAGRLDSQ